MAIRNGWRRCRGTASPTTQRIFTRRTDGETASAPTTKHGMSLGDFVALMDRAGVEVGVLRAGNAIIADVLAQYPQALHRSCHDQPA